MQTAGVIKAWLESALDFLARHPVPFAVAALVLALIAWYVWSHRPEDLTGNGIAIGEAKAFDSSSLTLRLQRLNSGLEALKVVNQSITENLSAVQERSSAESSGSLTFGAKEKDGKAAGSSEDKDKKDSGTAPKKSPESPDSKKSFGLGAGDILANQLNLASQVFSVQAVYEGSLSDRMIEDKSRLQTVLGFHVSISPPAGYEDSVAVVEMAVRIAASIFVAPENPPQPRLTTWLRSIVSKIASPTADSGTTPVTPPPATGTAPPVTGTTPPAATIAAGLVPLPQDPNKGDKTPVAPAVIADSKPAPAVPPAAREKAVPAQPVSLVALMPQEKTYNAEFTMSSDRSIDGSATVRWLRLGARGRRGSRGEFMRRDPETVAFERKPQGDLDLLTDATSFGWEFRPELGRSSVAPGPRQLMAVIAVPKCDDMEPAETILEVKTRSYWRRYNRNKQTSGPAWSWLPWRVDRSGSYTSTVQRLKIPNTAKIQSTLAPHVTEVNWTDAGGGKAYVTVSGRNFFSGTKVLIGGQTKSEKDATLTLKSEQTLEFEAPLTSLAFGSALLIGRYGEAIRLEDGRQRSSDSLAIFSASLRPIRNTKLLLLTVDIFGRDRKNVSQPLDIGNLSTLPDPILCVGDEPVPGPYDMSIQSIESTGTEIPPNVLRVVASISPDLLAKSREVSFQLPFCGLDYYVNQPMAFSEPTVTRMGSDAANTVFRLYFPQIFSSQTVNVELDRTYAPGVPAVPGSGELQPMGMNSTPNEYRFTVPADLVSRYQNMVVRVGKSEPYVIAIPQEEKPPTKAVIDPSNAPARVIKGKRSSVEWQGTGLDTIKAITFTPLAPADSTEANSAPIVQPFLSYGAGTRLIVYLSQEVVANEGKSILDCATTSGAALKIPLFVSAS